MTKKDDEIKALQNHIGELEESLEMHKKWLSDGLINERRMKADHAAEVDSYKAEVDTLADQIATLVGRDDAGVSVGVEGGASAQALADLNILELPNGMRAVSREAVDERQEEWVLLDREVTAVVGEQTEIYSLAPGVETRLPTGERVVIITELATYAMPLDSEDSEDGDDEGELE